MSKGRIAFQGELGANSHEACMAAFPHMEPVPNATFEEAFDFLNQVPPPDLSSQPSEDSPQPVGFYVSEMAVMS